MTRVAEAPVHFARIFAGRGSIWQQDAAYYHERILHAPGQLRGMIDYVKDNPRWLKSHNPELFRLHRRTEAAGLLFTSMGNHFLLDWPDKKVVEMSRSATVSSRLTRWPSGWLKIWIRSVSLTNDNNGYKGTIESDG